MQGGLTGLLNTSIALGSSLRDAGHTVIYASPTDHSQQIVDSGFQFERLAPCVFQPWRNRNLNWSRRLGQRAAVLRECVTAFGIADFVQTLDELKPDLVLIDIELHPHIFSAVGAGFPVALMSQFVTPFRDRAVPPFSWGIIPGAGWFGSANGIRLAWQMTGLAATLRRLIGLVHLGGIDQRAVLGALAKSSGFKFRPVPRSQQVLLPYDVSGFPIISLPPPSFDFPHVPPANVRHVGAMVHRNRQETALNAADQAILNSVLERRQAGESQLVFASCSTFATVRPDYIRRIIEAVASRPDTDLILTLGGNVSREDLPPLPRGVHVFERLANPIAVLEHADCAVLTAGINMITECLATETPMLLYSMGHIDQNGNAARVLFHQIGLTGSIHRDDPSEMRQKIDTLLETPSFKNNVSEMLAKIVAQHDERAPARVIEEIIQNLDTQNC